MRALFLAVSELGHVGFILSYIPFYWYQTLSLFQYHLYIYVDGIVSARPLNIHRVGIVVGSGGICPLLCARPPALSFLWQE